MNTIDERNLKIKNILDLLYNIAIDKNKFIDETPYQHSLDVLFQTSAWGFREILLVVIVAMKLDNSFRASMRLYDCNPRAIYEGPIKDFLISKNIPHRKSGPLNVAKATLGLDKTWAAQRRPSNVALEVTKIVEYMEETNSEINERTSCVGVSLMRRLIEQTKHLENLAIEIVPSSDPEYLYDLCYNLITDAPDAGNTPQKIVAFLLKNYHASMDTGVEVAGDKDRAFVTSTTSKKPGDITEEKAGRIYKVYEITVKRFDISRIRDSYDCISIYSAEHNCIINEIIVICRPEDCPSSMKNSELHGYLGSYYYQGVCYYYMDIFEWIANILLHMTTDGRNGFHNNLNDYISEINTAESVKKLWRKLHTTN